MICKAHWFLKTSHETGRKTPGGYLTDSTVVDKHEHTSKVFECDALPQAKSKATRMMKADPKLALIVTGMPGHAPARWTAWNPVYFYNESEKQVYKTTDNGFSYWDTELTLVVRLDATLTLVWKETL